ncbi:probable tRNA N6-adenosine threonylcarbamoyltransferase, mitochondrial isoform X3 [Phoenix dactylifera]|uniref:Glycoprotease 1 n=1 Tax=Phoenix dactylifera TaxID=42345 RepID=A0A8B8J2K7_PHODC|nr:probable tRNA N6-adenosine threonylcarbamoyltransferase, mitochondrial isoform X3 [Phoenix dactylifera]
MASSTLASPLWLSRSAFLLKTSLLPSGTRALTRGFTGPRQPPTSLSPLSLKPSFKHLSAIPSASGIFAQKSSDLERSFAREDVVILGIETSCDDTAAAVVRGNGEILSQVVSSQADLLSRYGGVAPKMAEEAHSLVIDQVVQQTLDNANLTEKNLSAVAVTIGPGLSLCLRVGVCKARRIAGNFSLPIIGIHHMEAHALVARLVEKDLQFPFLALLISGGHNLLILAHGLGHYVQLGTTIDDAIGEAYDKTARWLGLDMRKGGGPALEELAREGDANSFKFSIPMRQHKDCNFSYAGLKTQVRMAIESKNLSIENNSISSTSSQERRLRADIAASFQVVSGGVASNQYVRTRLNHVVEKNGLQLACPPPSLCTDNGVMVAWTGIEHFLCGRFDPPPRADEPEDSMVRINSFWFDLRPRWPLGEEHSQGKSEARSLKRARVHPSLTSIIQGSAQQEV